MAQSGCGQTLFVGDAVFWTSRLANSMLSDILTYRFCPKLQWPSKSPVECSGERPATSSDAMQKDKSASRK